MTNSTDTALSKMLTEGNTRAISLTNSSMAKEQSNTPMATLTQVGSIRTRSMAEVSSRTQTEQLRKESSKTARSNIGEVVYTNQF